jgi:uncharacterized membrane protein
VAVVRRYAEFMVRRLKKRRLNTMTAKVTYNSMPTSPAGARANFLRRTIQVDGLVEIGLGLGTAVAAGWLAPLFGIAQGWLIGIGLVFIVYGAVLLRLGAPEAVNRQAAFVVACLNGAAAVLIAAALLSGWLPIATTGKWFLVLLADVALVLAVVQFYAFRRSSP